MSKGKDKGRRETKKPKKQKPATAPSPVKSGPPKN